MKNNGKVTHNISLQLEVSVQKFDFCQVVSVVENYLIIMNNHLPVFM